MLGVTFSRNVSTSSPQAASNLPAPRRQLTASVLNVFVRFFSEKDSPWNLAIFRVVFFAYILLTFNKANVLWFSRLPSELIIPPVGWKHILLYLPINPALADFVCMVFVIACFCALVGLFTKCALWISVVSGIYVLGIPQFFGKVNHYHEWIWFMMILAVSRCADVFSLDAVRQAFNRADNGEQLGPPENTVGYALPLRFVWLLIGVAYFFPGLWKVIRSPWHWAFSDNLKYQMYAYWFWFEGSGWTPAFRIDHYPWLYKMAALGTILFELSFIFLVLFPALRGLALVGGLIFHNMTDMFMRISFRHLQICYVSLVNWTKLAAWLAKLLFKEELVVVYDGSCKICRRTIAVLQRFDVFQRTVYLNALDDQKLKERNLTWIAPADRMRDMHAILGKNKWKGYECYRTLAGRIPILWPVWPFLWIWPVPALGKMIYRKVADSRSCSIRKQMPVGTAAVSVINTSCVRLVGTSLIVINVLFGATGTTNSWPFACYPTFDRIIATPTTETLMIGGVRDGKEELIDLQSLKNQISATKLRGMTHSILAEKDTRRQNSQLSATLPLLVNSGVDVSQYSKIRFYKAVKSTEPGEYSKSPISSSMLFEYDVRNLRVTTENNQRF
jgi:predicted DCC family thiol-disulfide oxidoreductase YuxK